MKIHSVKCNNCKEILFSFTRHHYNQCQCTQTFLDGGFNYIRTNTEVEFVEIKDVIEEIRNQFTWIQTRNEKDELLEESKTLLLKNLTSSHICGILSYLNYNAFNQLDENEYSNVDKQWLIFHEIFTQELLYRITNKLI